MLNNNTGKLSVYVIEIIRIIYQRRCSMDITQRIVNLESKITYQEISNKELSDIIYRQQLQIKQLEKTCNYLLQQLKEATSTTNSNGKSLLSDIPPHY